jgi:ABC-type antimicrobial peptide transport system permease subunit
MILKDGALTTVIGVTLGIAGSLFVTRAMESLLFGVSPTDPVTFGGITSVIVLVTLTACWIPARRATRVDPLVALRYE